MSKVKRKKHEFDKTINKKRYFLTFNSLGQITIPKNLREVLHLTAESIVMVELDEGMVKIIPVEVIPKARTLKDRIVLQEELAKSYAKGPTGTVVNVKQLMKELEE